MKRVGYIQQREMLVETGGRTCKRCEVFKPRSEFLTEKNFRIGIRPICKPCKNLETREYQHRRRKERPAEVHARDKKKAYKYRVAYATHKQVRAAVQAGILKRPEKCTECKLKGKIEGHHPDYAKPLDVIWLCATCHKNLHYKLRYPQFSQK